MNIVALFSKIMWLDGMEDGIFLVYMKIAKKKTKKKKLIFLI